MRHGRIAYGTAVIKTRAPGAKPSRCAAFPPFTARLTSPALSGESHELTRFHRAEHIPVRHRQPEMRPLRKQGTARLDADLRGIRGGDGELDIAESVHGHYFAFRGGIADDPFRGGQRDQIARVDFGLRRGQIRVRRQMRGDRHEDIAAVNVAATTWRRYSVRLVRLNARAAPPAAATAQESRPLSGPTNIEVPASTAMPRLAVPTPGSTTATWTAGGR